MRKAERLSDQAENGLGIGGMSHDELRVRAAILGKMSRSPEAIVCIQDALLRKGLSPDSEVLLETVLGEIKSESGQPEDAQAAYHRAANLIPNTKPATAVSYYISWANHLKRQGHDSAGDVFRKARAVAEAHELHDQVFRINSIFHRQLKFEP